MKILENLNKLDDIIENNFCGIWFNASDEKVIVEDNKDHTTFPFKQKNSDITFNENGYAYKGRVRTPEYDLMERVRDCKV